MVRQEDYRIGKAIKRRHLRLKLLYLASVNNIGDEQLLRLAVRAENARIDVNNIHIRSMSIKNKVFDLNEMSEEESLHHFRFRKNDVRKISDIIGFSGPTKRNRYKVESLTACCILLKRISSAVTWFNLELLFDMRYSHMSEAFWETLEKFTSEKSHLITEFRR